MILTDYLAINRIEYETCVRSSLPITFVSVFLYQSLNYHLHITLLYVLFALGSFIYY